MHLIKKLTTFDDLRMAWNSLPTLHRRRADLVEKIKIAEANGDQEEVDILYRSKLDVLKRLLELS